MTAAKSHHSLIRAMSAENYARRAYMGRSTPVIVCRFIEA